MTEEMGASESVVIMLVQQYAAKFGITFSSSLMNDEKHKQKLIQLMGQAISGKRGAVTDSDVLGEDEVD
ncbi:MAG: hypothetical protein RLZZ351_1010 [Pseudomonadota bacterium]|jgi:hypothetical protein